MLHEITYGILTEIKENQKQQRNNYEISTKNIESRWKIYEQDAQSKNLKGFEIYSIDSNQMFGTGMDQIGQICIYLNDDESVFNYKISFQNIQFQHEFKIQQNSAKEFKQVIKWLINNKNEYNIILTLFFFYHFEKVKKNESSVHILFSKEFCEYIEDTINQVNNIRKFFNIASTLKQYKLNEDVLYINQKMNVNIDEISKHKSDFDDKYLLYMSNQSKVSCLNYFQHYINSEQQLNAFFQGSQQGEFILGIENNECCLTKESADLQLEFNNYYSQYLFSDLYREQILKDKIKYLFFNFCIFLKSDYKNHNQRFSFTLNDELILQFLQYLNKYKTISTDVQNSPQQYQNQLQQTYLQDNNNKNNQFDFIQNSSINQQNKIIYGDSSNQQYKPLYSNFKNIGNLLMSNDLSRENIPNNSNKQDEEIIQENRLSQLNIQNQIKEEEESVSNCKDKIYELETNLSTKQQEYELKLEEVNQLINQKNQQIESYQKQILTFENTIQQNQLKDQHSQQIKQNNLMQQDQITQKQQKEYDTNLNQSDEEINNLDQQIKIKQEDINNIVEHMDSYKSQLRYLQTEIQQKENQLLEVKDQLQKQSLYNESLNTLIKEKEQLIEQNNIQINKFKQQVSQKNIDNKKMDEHDNYNQQDINDEKIDYSAQIKLLFNEIKQLQNKIININKQSQLNECIQKISQSGQLFNQNQMNEMSNYELDKIRQQELNDVTKKIFECGEQERVRNQQLQSLEQQIEFKMEMLEYYTNNVSKQMVINQNKNELNQVQQGITHFTSNQQQNNNQSSNQNHVYPQSKQQSLINNQNQLQFEQTQQVSRNADSQRVLIKSITKYHSNYQNTNNINSNINQVQNQNQMTDMIDFKQEETDQIQFSEYQHVYSNSQGNKSSENNNTQLSTEQINQQTSNSQNVGQMHQQNTQMNSFSPINNNLKGVQKNQQEMFVTKQSLKFLIFQQIYNNYSTLQVFLSHIQQKYNLRVVIDQQDAQLQLDVSNFKNNSQLDSLIIIDKTYNAYVQITKQAAYIFVGTAFIVNCNTTINKNAYSEAFGQIIQKSFGEMKSTLVLPNEFYEKQNESVHYLWNYLSNVKKIDIFNFISTNNILPDFYISYIQKMYNGQAYKLLEQFNSQTKYQNLIIITHQTQYTAFRYFKKNDANEIQMVQEVLVCECKLDKNVILAQFQKEFNYDTTLQRASDQIFIDFNEMNQVELIKIFLVTYAPLFIQQQISNNDLKNMILNTENYTNLIFQNNFI